MNKERILNIDTLRNENGELYIHRRGKKEIIENLEEWQKVKIVAWDIWMYQMNTIFIELTGKPYEELDEMEWMVIEYEMTVHRYPPR